MAGRWHRSLRKYMGQAPLVLLVRVRRWRATFVPIGRWKAHSRQGDRAVVVRSYETSSQSRVVFGVDFVPRRRLGGRRSVDTTKVKYP